jgi:hypothetical protein
MKRLVRKTVRLEKRPDKSDSRWWEYYAVRYALGVGIGTPLIGLLWQQYHPLIPLTVKILSPFESTVSALLCGAGGMAFCYVASVPMLTFHSTRRVLSRRWGWVLALFVCVIGAALTGIALDRGWVSSILSLQAAAMIVLAISFLLQLFLLGNVFLDPGPTHDFYDGLQANRAKQSDLVESYRHMREHGNSVSIVLCELLLAFCLWALKTTTPGETSAIARICLIVGIWLLPSSLVWLVGSSLERHVSRGKQP